MYVDIETLGEWVGIWLLEWNVEKCEAINKVEKPERFNSFKMVRLKNDGIQWNLGVS